MKLYITILLVFLLFSCGKKNNKIQYNYNAIKIKIFVKDGRLKTSDIFESSKYYLLEADEDKLIGEITKVENFNNKFYILDSRHAKSVFVYNNQWKFVKKIQYPGKGPGEFISITDFNVNKYTQNIEILDDNQNKIIKYDLNGNFTNSEIRFQPWGFCFGIINKDEYALSSMQIFNGSFPNDLYIILKSGKIKGSYFPNSKKYSMNFTTQTCFYNGLDSLLYKPNYSDTIFSVAKTIKPYLIVDFGKAKLPKDMIIITKTIEDLKESNYAYHISNYIESNEYIYFNFSFRKEFKHVFYSKKTHKVKYGYELIEDYDGLPISVPVFFHHNKFICIYPGFVCDFYKNPENNEYFNKLSTKVKSLINNSNKFSNGIVAEYKIKQF